MAVAANPLLEREAEMDAIGRALDGLAADGGRAIVVEGPPGIGKSALIGASRELAAERGVRVLSARGSELELEFPYGVVRQLFEGELLDPERRRLLLGDAAAAAAGLFDPLAGEVAGEEAQGTFAALHGLLWLTLNISAGEPLALIVDDLHWSDRPSLRFCSYLAHRLDSTPIALIAGLRDTEPGTDPELIAAIGAEPETLVVRPVVLSDEAVSAIVTERLGGEHDADFDLACSQATGGNPLLLRQLLSAVEGEGARSGAAGADLIRSVGGKAVSRSVRLRLGRLGDEATAVAHALATLGEGTDVATVAALTELDPETVAAATGGLARAEILRPDLPLGFVHPLVLHAVHAELAPGEQELLHERAAMQLRDAGAPVERIAAHLLASPARGEEWVAALLADAARSAAAKGASDSVVTYLRRLLQEPLADQRRLEVTYELGVAETDFEGAGAMEHLREVWERSEDPVMATQAAAILARTLMFMGAGIAGAELLAEAVEKLPPEFGELHRMLEALALIGTVFTGEEAIPAERQDELRSETFPDDVSGRMLSAAVAHRWAISGGPRDECVALAERAVADEELMSADNGLLWVAATTTLLMAEMGDPDRAWAEALERAHRRGTMFLALSVHVWRGWTLHHYGQLAEAEASLVQGLEEMRMWTSEDRLHDHPIGLLGSIHVDQGSMEAARKVLGSFDRPEDRSGGAAMRRQGLIDLALAEGRGADALRLADELGANLLHASNPAWHPWRSLRAQALAMTDRDEEALEAVEEELALARDWGAPGPIGRALRVRGQVRREEGMEDLQEAVALLEGSWHRLELARALAALGGALRRARRPSDARDPLMRALGIAESCGARPLESEVRTELRATGLRPRTAAISGAGSLTPSERRVAELAAEGRTNKEIAQALYVTPKTVEVHLSNCYRKLDISSRRQLAGALAD